jgi:hypothetical protein
MPIWQLDPAFFHEELKELIYLGHIKIIGAFSFLNPTLIYCQWLFAPHYFCCSYFLFIILFLSLICPFEELIVDVSYVIVFDKSGVFLEAISLIAHQRQSVRQLAKVIELHAEQLFPNSQQHPCYSHTSQLIIWYVQREAHAFCLSETPEELHWCFIVPLP